MGDRVQPSGLGLVTSVMFSVASLNPTLPPVLLPLGSPLEGEESEVIAERDLCRYVWAIP